MLEVKGSVAVVTGGAGGIGYAIAEYWVKNGGKVVICDVQAELLEKAAASLTALGGEVATVVCNVTSEEDCGRLADTAIEKFGAINLVAPFAGSDARFTTARRPRPSASQRPNAVLPVPGGPWKHRRPTEFDFKPSSNARGSKSRWRKSGS